LTPRTVPAVAVGQIVGVVGKNGCGKSTRLLAVPLVFSAAFGHLLFGVLVPCAGRFTVAGAAVRQVFHVEHDGHPAAHSLGAVALAAAERPHAR
jgi:ABC-type dipeptide/oligopeptide/nickel transport system ATPase subunit